MTRFPKLIAMASATLALAFTASAESRFEATIVYQPGPTIQSTFDSLSEQVIRACRRELSQNGKVDLGVARRFTVRCHEELMTNAVKSINDPVLTAYFNGSQPEIRQLASR